MQDAEEGKNKQKSETLLADTKIPKHTKIQKRKQNMNPYQKGQKKKNPKVTLRTTVFGDWSVTKVIATVCNKLAISLPLERLPCSPGLTLGPVVSVICCL